ncbi:HERV-H LTR-associating protein 2 [Rana temporaria]|uniref:HERV-H LTR-associating protein 2 n=1 Tax=Rana temporaria TaxID=8407 RepID=UPI001AAD8A9D|nr:HERV-H LTR-associating protein 2 [Rana temporaria]XP_040192575.1 HERV-H LTR-associating protein 2 [Rana temporaria]XP_040192577.1 HERV-H LTR-associating protein 2 [Rana temporaria]XP_040192578.1 HERV-H LTR-associating protein 2 [Rana temporaria]
MKLLILLQIFRLFLFVHGTIDVVGELNGVVILPCSFTPGKDEVIHWTINENQNVHRYYYGKDVLKDQVKSYAGRTSLFLDQIKNGNASLQLKKLQKSDEKKYSCYVSTMENKLSKVILEVLLKVKAAVWGEIHKNVTIPCSFNPGEEVVIHWWITSDASRIVHKYYRGQDRLEEQEKSYKGRTSLILSELTNGNASLQIRELQDGDENTYSCYVGTNKGKNEESVKLNVADFGHAIEYTLDHNVPNLKCYASRAYLADTVTIEWYEENHKIQENNSNPGLCSSCNLTKKTNSYKCIIRHSVVENTWTGMWQTNATEQNNVECSCRYCKTVNAEMSARLYLRKNTTEVPVASVNNSLLVIAEDYRSKVQTLEKCRLCLINLTANDNGDYICEIRTLDGYFISLTSVNITNANENHQRNRWMVLTVLLSLLCFVLFLVFGKRKSLSSRGVQSGEAGTEEL